jgi:hypothetical protein
MMQIILISLVIILLLCNIVSFFRFKKYKKIVKEELDFYEDKLSDEISKSKEIEAEYDSKKHLLDNPHPEDLIKVENKDIKEDLDQRTDNIYGFLSKISNQIDYLHYQQLNISKIEKKKNNSELLTSDEHHNYIEYILHSHNIKSEIDYFSSFLVPIENKIPSFSFFINLSDENNLILDTKLFQYIIEYNHNLKNNKSDSEEILQDRINKYFEYIRNPRYVENIRSYFFKKKIIKNDSITDIIIILPTVMELEKIQSFLTEEISSIIQKKELNLIYSKNLFLHLKT